MEIKIRLQGKNAIITGTPKEIKKVIDSMNDDYNAIKQSLINTVKLPEVKELVDFIESKQPSFEHSMPEILTKYIGNDQNLRGNRKIYDAVFRKTKEARTIIEVRHKGIFKVEKEEQHEGDKRSLRKITIYKFEKNSGGT